MGKVASDGEYHFEPGHGRGLFGMPYKADSPMWEASFPHWTSTPENRLATIVTYLERRASRRHQSESGTPEERLEKVTGKLAMQHAAHVARAKTKSRLETLHCTENWPQKVVAMVAEHWPQDDRIPVGWDAGQCAYRQGISSHAALVRHLFINLNRIGEELFPDSEQEKVDVGF